MHVDPVCLCATTHRRASSLLRLDISNNTLVRSQGLLQGLLQGFASGFAEVFALKCLLKCLLVRVCSRDAEGRFADGCQRRMQGVRTVQEGVRQLVRKVTRTVCFIVECYPDTCEKIPW